MRKPRVIVAPAPLPDDGTWPTVYLGGTIDMGESEDWQTGFIEALADRDVVVLNPRRTDWNPTWKPVADEPHFREQVDWELEGLELADIVVLHLAAGSQSPISLLEFGLYAKTGKLILHCAPEYFRSGNIEITALRYGTERVSSMDQLIEAVGRRLEMRRDPVDAQPSPAEPA